MKYIYPAIFTEEEDGILVDFPDLPSCYTDGATLDEAFENAEDALAPAGWTHSHASTISTSRNSCKMPSARSAASVYKNMFQI